nr:arf-GAP with dual PH domain-containing protein 1 isoform X3 [Kogia breviceps]
MRLGAKAEEGAGPAPPGGLPTFLAEAPSPQCCRSRALVVPLGPQVIENTGQSPGPCSHPKRTRRVPARCSHTPACLSHLPRGRKEKGGSVQPVERGWPGLQGKADARSRPPASRHLGAAHPPGAGTRSARPLPRQGGSRQPGSAVAVRLGPSPPGYREGFLWKRGRDNGQFLSRKFVLTEREGALKYFNRSDAKEPKAIMKIEHLNATFQPAKIGHPHGLQVTYLKDNSTRNIFVYHEDGKEMVDWFNALRAARFHYLQVAFPGASDADLVPKLSRNYLQEGYMEKTGPKQTEGFRKRWFTMDDRRLMYFKDPLDAFARGEVFIGSRESGYTVLDGLPPSTQGHHWPHGITIVTPERRFLLACETESEQRAWMEAFRKVVDRPMLPQEYAVEAHFKHKP